MFRGQLIANALGASVSRNQHQEVGLDGCGSCFFTYPKLLSNTRKINIMQWHSETFEIPKGGVRLAEIMFVKIKCIKLGAMYWVSISS